MVPTVARPTLAGTLRSLAGQLLDGDEVVLVPDGERFRAAALAAARGLGLPLAVVRCPGPHRDWGAAARTLGMRRARGRLLLFMDDDDAYLPGALAAVREAAAGGPALHVFRMEQGGRVIWTDAELRPGNVSTQMIAVPNLPALPTWEHRRYDHDYAFAAECAKLLPVRWHETVIARYRDGHATGPGEAPPL